ncbi:MAG TPA: polysaccharide biosynthesis/export family protein [Acetobacteraceae bacterium]|nr:polysaccharide biosynthesis/export family protein [Acetobacteraceae bacterium]
MKPIPACMLTALLLVLTACAPGRGLPALSPPPQDAYRLGPGDQVRVITVAEDTLTGQFSVDAAGRIAVPMLGSLPAAGLSPAELGDEVAAALVKRGLVRAPSVSVEVIRYRPIFVLGEVNKPGEFPYQPGMTLLGSVALAGGFTYRAVEDRASVVRTSDGHTIEGLAGRESALQPGDVITIFERTM